MFYQWRLGSISVPIPLMRQAAKRCGKATLLKVENLGRIVFEEKGVSFESSYYDAPFKRAYFPTDGAR